VQLPRGPPFLLLSISTTWVFYCRLAQSFQVDGFELNSIWSVNCISKALKALKNKPKAAEQEQLAKRAILSALLPVIDPTWLAPTADGSVEVWVRGNDIRPVRWNDVCTSSARMFWQPSDNCIELLCALGIDKTYFAGTATIRGPPPAVVSHLTYAKELALFINPLEVTQQERMLVGLLHTQPMCSTSTFAAHGAVMVGCGMPDSLKDKTMPDPGAAVSETTTLMDSAMAGLCHGRLKGYHEHLASCLHSAGMGLQTLAGKDTPSVPTMAVASGVDLLVLLKQVSGDCASSWDSVLQPVLKAAAAIGLHMDVVQDPMPQQERIFTLGGDALCKEGRPYLVCGENSEALALNKQQLQLDLTTVVDRHIRKEAIGEAGLIAGCVGASESGFCNWTDVIKGKQQAALFQRRYKHQPETDPHDDPILSAALAVHGLRVFWIPCMNGAGGMYGAGRCTQVVAQAGQVDAVSEAVCKQLLDNYEGHDRVGSLVSKVYDLLEKTPTRYAEAGSLFEEAARVLELDLNAILQSTWRPSNPPLSHPMLTVMLLFPAFLHKHRHLVDEFMALREPGNGWRALSSLPDRLQQFMSVQAPNWTQGVNGISTFQLRARHFNQLSLDSSLQLPFGVVTVKDKAASNTCTFYLVLDADAEAALRDAVGRRPALNAVNKKNVLQDGGPPGVEPLTAKRQRFPSHKLQCHNPANKENLLEAECPSGAKSPTAKRQRLPSCRLQW